MTERTDNLALRTAISAGEDAFLAFQDLTPDGFMMFRPVRDGGGTITDLEWTFVNPAAGSIIGREPADLIGKHLLIEMPGNKDEGLFDAYVAVIETGDIWQKEFHYAHGAINAWFRVTAARAQGGGLAVSFADITEVRKGEERLRSLIDGVLAFVGMLSPDGILLEVNEPAIAAAGQARDRLIGLPFWDCYWWSFDEASQDRLKAAVAAAAEGEPVRYDAEIRVVGDRRIWIDFQIWPIVNDAGVVTELIPSGVDITERKIAESHRELLVNELSHRVKNTLAAIQSMARQTVRTATAMEDFRAAFTARLQAIAASHDLLVESEHRNASLAGLVRGQVQPYAADDSRLILQGPDILLPGDVAHLLGLVLHELATNASKYGALSVDTGTVTVAWRVASGKLLLDWTERGGPEVKKPKHQGFGSRLIERSLAADADGAIFDFAPEGLTCRLELALQ